MRRIEQVADQTAPNVGGIYTGVPVPFQVLSTISDEIFPQLRKVLELSPWTKKFMMKSK